MARELVNLSTQNEKLQQQTQDYPVLKDQYKVYLFTEKNGRFLMITFAFRD